MSETEHQGYPLILGGDHAAYEIEHAGMDPRLRSDWPLPSFDAQDWAEAFCKIFKVTKRGEPLALDADDHGLMVTWFANSLMRGYDEQTARLEPVIAELLGAIKAALPVMIDAMRDDYERVDGEDARAVAMMRAAIAKAEAC